MMICSLAVKIAHREGKSFMKDAYVTQPFRIVPVGQYQKDNAAYLMIMSSSPGLLDGDDHQIKIEVAPGAKLQLQTQAYQRLFHMKGHSSQTMQVTLGEGSVFSYVPHPVVPQHSSHFLSHNIIHLASNCHLLLSEIVTCGRKMSGEEFQYNHFQNLTECYVNSRLVVKDNVLLQPDRMPIQGLGILEGYTHQGTLIYLNSAGVSPEEWIEAFYAKYGETKDVAFGISALQHDGFIVRVLGYGAEQLYLLFKEMQHALWEKLFLN